MKVPTGLVDLTPAELFALELETVAKATAEGRSNGLKYLSVAAAHHGAPIPPWPRAACDEDAIGLHALIARLAKIVAQQGKACGERGADVPLGTGGRARQSLADERVERMARWHDGTAEEPEGGQQVGDVPLMKFLADAILPLTFASAEGMTGIVRALPIDVARRLSRVMLDLDPEIQEGWPIERPAVPFRFGRVSLGPVFAHPDAGLSRRYQSPTGPGQPPGRETTAVGPRVRCTDAPGCECWNCRGLAKLAELPEVDQRIALDVGTYAGWASAAHMAGLDGWWRHGEIYFRASREVD